MNDSRKFEALRSAFIDLISMGMPNVLIEKLLGISTSTIINYLKKRKDEDNSFEGKTTPFKESVPRMLMLLSCLSFRRKPLHSWMKLENIQRLELMDALDEILERKKIVEILDYASCHLHNLKQFEFTPDVPEGYVNFLNAINIHEKDFRCQGLNLWHSYLENRVYADKEGIAKADNWQKFTIDQILKEVSSFVRNDVSPVFTGDVCQRINVDLFDTITETEGLVLKMFFGLGESKLSLSEISKRLNMKESRVRQIMYKAIKHCKYANRYHLIFVKPSIEEKRMIDSSVEERIVKSGHELIDLDLSVRALNMYRHANIKYLEELALMKIEDVMKIQNIGLKTIDQTKQLLEKYGLSFRK